MVRSGRSGKGNRLPQSYRMRGVNGLPSTLASCSLFSPPPSQGPSIPRGSSNCLFLGAQTSQPSPDLRASPGDTVTRMRACVSPHSHGALPLGSVPPAAPRAAAQASGPRGLPPVTHHPPGMRHGCPRALQTRGPVLTPVHPWARTHTHFCVNSSCQPLLSSVPMCKDRAQAITEVSGAGSQA